MKASTLAALIVRFVAIYLVFAGLWPLCVSLLFATSVQGGMNPDGMIGWSGFGKIQMLLSLGCVLAGILGLIWSKILGRWIALGLDEDRE